MYNRLEAINKALLASEFSEAAILSKKLRMTVPLSKEFGTNIIDEYEDLLDWLLELADQLFASGPIDADKRNLQRQLRKASEMLTIGSVAAAAEAAGLIANAKKTYEQRLQQLEKVGYYDHDTFCLFWELWLLLDEILRHPSFPIKKYDDYASRLYGTITSALRSKKAVLCLAKFSEDIFPDEE